MVRVRGSITGVAVMAALGTLASAQPPQQAPPPTPPTAPPPAAPTNPPPPTPPANWAPPLQETPPREDQTNAPAGEATGEQATGEQPTSSGANTTETPIEPERDTESTKLEIYGFTMFDGGYDFGRLGDPNWQDVMRPTKLPAFRNEFGKGDRTFMSVRQTRFGVKANTPTPAGDFKTQFEFELFGVGVDEGQTTFRLRHAYGDWRHIRAGQTWSPFMDIDVFPNSLEYWGPNGMAFFRNVQLAWMPIQGESRVTVALERPGASPDTGIYAGRIELDNIVARFPLPDLSAEARWGGPWGYLELAGIVRYIGWDDLDDTPPDLGDHVWGWGLNLSSNVKLGPALLRMSAIYGRAIENYMNDAGADVAPKATGDPLEPIAGEALPIVGLVAFVDMKWSDLFTSAVGWSMVWIDNAEAQTPDAFHLGNYALGNLLYHPTEKLMMGAEFQYGRRDNNSDGWDANDFKIQVSLRFSFGKTFGGE